MYFSQHIQKRPVSSTIDYLVTNNTNFEYIKDFCVLDLTEQSDHCPVTFSLNGIHERTRNSDNGTASYDKINWDTSKKDIILESLKDKRCSFKDLTEKLLSDEIEINQCIEFFSNIIFEVSFEYCGKTIPREYTKVKHKAEWFDDDCKKAKNDFLKS